MKKKILNALVLLASFGPLAAFAEECEPSRWTVTLDHLEPLTAEEREFVLDMLGIELSLDTIEQAIAEDQVPMGAFGGE